MKGKIVGVLRTCKTCKQKFAPLSHNHTYCKKCQGKHKLAYYIKYNKTRKLFPVKYKYTHTKKKSKVITKQALAARGKL